MAPPLLFETNKRFTHVLGEWTTDIKFKFEAGAECTFTSPPPNLYRVVDGSLKGADMFTGFSPSMLNDVYNKRILELAADIPKQGRLSQPDASATAHSKLCGSTVTVDLRVQDGKIADFAHDVKACALGQASSSIMARHVVGSTPEEMRSLRDQVRRMLKENGAPPQEGKWADVGVLEPVRDYKARHASTLLTFDAVVDALNQIETKNQTG